MSVSVVIAGGGTGGHIEPALALADALRRADPDVAITCLGTERGLETRLVPMRGYDLALIPPVPLPRRLTPALLSVPSRMFRAVECDGRDPRATRADVLVGFGGYVATPGYLAARRRKVPIVVHEANAKPGLANRIGARLTKHVCTGQQGTRLPHARYVGIPIRHEIAGLDRMALADKARAHFGFQPDLPVLLVTGGLAGRRIAQPGRSRRSRRAARSRRPGAARGRPQDWRGRSGAWTCALRGAAVPGPDGPRIRGSGLRACAARAR